MKQLNQYITEKFKISSKTISKQYTCQPKDKFELRKILEERLKEDKDADLNDIDISQITDMSYEGFPKDKGLFEGLDPHNIDISKWNVSNVKYMDYMFDGCINFKGKGLENWDVSNVEHMTGMFVRCNNFNSDLHSWDVSNVTNMYGMFNKCINFKGEGLDNWDVSKVKDMKYMFDGCKKFEGKGLDNWNVSNVKNMWGMFNGCDSLKNKPSWYK